MIVETDKVREIFLAALKVPPARRAAHLDDACAGVAELRQQVERLLQAHQELGSVAEAAAAPAEPLTQSADAVCVGAVIGPYKLLQQIGEGGMGAVYMAEQTEPVRRKVAIKIIKPGMDTRQVVARFEAERQALAVMDHPNIAKVLDAGTTSGGQENLPGDTPLAPGRPYFVMELVKGVPITNYCDDHNLTTRERLELFVPICHAVQHAHQKGVIHRDIKPSNVLVALYDDKPVPKIIDFGVAKATGPKLTERTMFTQFGTLIGTLEYMSPEQASFNALDIDTRSDIYSLGVLLYELLTGTTPFEKKRLREAAFDEMLRIIREEEPPKPSTRLSTTEELPRIAAHRRTEPAKLGPLVKGDLDWIVMKALEKDRGRRYETANGLAMDVQRHLADEPVAAGPPSSWYRLRKFVRRRRAALATVLLVATALVAITITLIISNSRIRMEKERAQEGYRQARQAVDDYFIQISESDLMDVPGLQPLRRELLQRALRYYQEFLAQQDRDPVVQAELAKAYFRVGLITFEIGSKAEALTAFEKARDIQKSLLQANLSAQQIRADLARTYGHLGIAQRFRGILEDAMRSHEREIALWDELTRADPNEPSYQGGLAGSHDRMGETLVLQARWEEALRSHELSRDIRERLSKGSALDPRSKNELAGTYMLIGQAQWLFHHTTLALDAYRNACEIRDQLVKTVPGKLTFQRDLAFSYRKLGECYRLDGQAEKAVAAYGTARRILKKLADDNPTVVDFHHRLAECHSGTAHTFWAKGDLAETTQWFERSLSILQEIRHTAPDSLTVKFDIGLISYYLGIVQYRAGQLVEASRSLQTARRLYEQLDSEHPQVPTARNLLASTYEALGDLSRWSGREAEAHEHYQAALATFERLVHDHGKDFFLVRFATFLVTCPDPKTRDVARALTLANQVVDQSPRFAGAWDALGIAHYYADRFVPATKALAKAVELDPHDKSSWVHLGMANFRAGQFPDARAALERAVALDDGGLGHQWLFLAMTQWRLGSKAEAIQSFDRAVKQMAKARTSSEELRRLHTEAAMLLGIKLPTTPARAGSGMTP